MIWVIFALCLLEVVQITIIYQLFKENKKLKDEFNKEIIALQKEIIDKNRINDKLNSRLRDELNDKKKTIDKQDDEIRKLNDKIKKMGETVKKLKDF